MPEPIPENLEQEVKQVIANATGRSIEDLKPEAHFFNDLGIDSIKAIEITVAIEKRFRIKIKDEQIPKISNVKEAVDLVRQGLEKKNAQ
jgi:acyl carrier protein